MKDEDGQYKPIHGHEHEVNYRKMMRNKSVVNVSAKRSDSISKRKYNGKNVVAEAQAETKSGNALSRQISSSSSSSSSNNNNNNNNNESDMKNIDADDIEIDFINMPHIVMSSPTTESENGKNSFFFDSGNRAPSPLTMQQQLTEKAVSEERDTIFSFVSKDIEDVAPERLPFHWNVRQTIFDEVDKEFYVEEMHSNEECVGDQSSGDSVEGSLGVVSNSTSSGNESSRNVDEWGSDSDVEDCFLLGFHMSDSLPTRASLR